MVQRYKGTKVQRYKGTMIQWLNKMVQYNGTMVQYKGSIKPYKFWPEYNYFSQARASFVLVSLIQDNTEYILNQFRIVKC